jgi:hypothetical protein
LDINRGGRAVENISEERKEITAVKIMALFQDRNKRR